MTEPLLMPASVLTRLRSAQARLWGSSLTVTRNTYSATSSGAVKPGAAASIAAGVSCNISPVSPKSIVGGTRRLFDDQLQDEATHVLHCAYSVDLQERDNATVDSVAYTVIAVADRRTSPLALVALLKEVSS